MRRAGGGNVQRLKALILVGLMLGLPAHARRLQGRGEVRLVCSSLRLALPDRSGLVAGSALS